MRKRNKLFDTWRKQVDLRIGKQLNEWFGEPPEDGSLRPVILRVDTAPFPEEFKPTGKITWKEFENVILPQAYELDIGSVYLDIVSELKKRIIDTHPDRHAVATTMRKSGLSVEQLLLEKIYGETEVTLELGDIIDTLDVDIIPEFEDVHIKTRNIGGEIPPVDKNAIQECFDNAKKRFLEVWNKKEDVKPIYKRPIKGNSSERLVVNFDYITEEFEMYYKSFPDYCCTCIVGPDENPEEALTEYAIIFTRSVFKHMWPNVDHYIIL